MKFKLILISVFVTNINCSSPGYGGYGKYNKGLDKYYYSTKQSAYDLSFKYTSSELKQAIEKNQSSSDINPKLEDFANSLSINFNGALEKCKRTKPSSVKNDEDDYKDLVKNNCNKLIKPLIKHVKETLKFLAKNENETYMNTFFRYLHNNYIEHIVKSNCKDETINDVLKEISFQIASKKFEELEEMEIE
ncbi:MAG: hypothetical protein GY830_01630 [Bacteroidetes bacterium]|nr:hypothetical protein [Bacteroidota bacterium]